jgi:hypothetical protein
MIAIIGERSIAPSGGMNRRKRRRYGSATSRRKFMTASLHRAYGRRIPKENRRLSRM